MVCSPPGLQSLLPKCKSGEGETLASGEVPQVVRVPSPRLSAAQSYPARARGSGLLAAPEQARLFTLPDIASPLRPPCPPDTQPRRSGSSFSCGNALKAESLPSSLGLSLHLARAFIQSTDLCWARRCQPCAGSWGYNKTDKDPGLLEHKSFGRSEDRQ